MSSRILLATAAFAFLWLSSLPGFAQATRTWVSGVGDDVNPCSRTAPCKTFAGAISKTAAGGEISVLDPGGFGALTITKSISLVSDGSEGSIVACGTNGIIINSATAIVSISGLYIEGCAGMALPGLSGIRVISAASVHIRKTLIRGFGNSGADTYAIDVDNTAGNTKVFVSDTTISNNLRGIGVFPGAGQTATVALDNVKVDNNFLGIRTGNGATVWMNNSVVTENRTGLRADGTSVVNSFGNNVISGNITEDTTGNPLTNVALK
jgi:hypothetical protein